MFDDECEEIVNRIFTITTDLESQTKANFDCFFKADSKEGLRDNLRRLLLIIDIIEISKTTKPNWAKLLGEKRLTELNLFELLELVERVKKWVIKA